ncbi:RNA methyltransferase [Fuchsiella alkaliacetigena]|uniref:RNA methyltransferase n=1 Tax=Fuchsiella alkaliacetigena TaxID=957042 RepID=UPI00200B7BC1|nr:RNA methyltransferase [Fuchsiella alkaliacetigena]MCK8825854.1 RNA methyltransferase [Fuchsiella alkaliacetigena]
MFYIALIHNPVYNKNQKVITTTVTNLDLHDIARAGRTYDVAKYYIVNPLDSQQELVERMREYWASDFGADYNSDRQEAFSVLAIKSELTEVIAEIEEREGATPKLIASDAREYDNSIGYLELRRKIQAQDDPYLLLLGTGWGLVADLIKDTDYILEPIYGQGDYNHLSVRSAASIILDRLLGEEWWSSAELTSSPPVPCVTNEDS